MTRKNRVVIHLSDKEKSIFKRNAAIYASVNGLDKVDTNEAARHFFLNMDAIGMLTNGDTKRSNGDTKRSNGDTKRSKGGKGGKGLAVTLHPDLAATFKHASDSTGQTVDALVNTTLFASLEQIEGVGA